MNTLEICVDCPEDLAIAVNARVDRIELCSSLDLGGLTPSPGLIEQAKSSYVPVYSMIRPRAGNFVYTELEIRAMEADIRSIRNAGLAGVVFGCLNDDKTLDKKSLSRLCEFSRGLGMTLHRAVDDMRSPHEAVGHAIELGFERILSSGGAETAVEGIQELQKMVSLSKGKIEIMAGSGVSHASVDKLSSINIHSFHASCRSDGNKVGAVCIDIQKLNRLQSVLKGTNQQAR